MAEAKETSRKSPVFRILVIGAVVLFILFGYVNRDVLYDTYQVLLDVQIGYLLLLPVIQIINYFLIGNYYRTMFERFNVKISLARSWGVVAAMNFVNQVLPSGGLSGISYLAYGFHAKISSGKTTLIQIGRYLSAFGSYLLLAPFAAAWLIIDGDSDLITDLVDRITSNPTAVVFSVLFVVFGLFLLIGFRSEAHSHRISGWVRSFVNAVVRPFRSDKTDLVTQKQVGGAIKEFHEGISFFKSARGKAVVPIFSMIGSTFLEMSVVYVSLLAVGVSVAPAVILVAFAAANAAGVVSVIPGDVGIHEAVIIFVLGAFSIPVSVALSATLLYRVFNKIIFFPVGFYFYTILLRPSKS